MTWQEVSALAESKVHLSLIQLVTMLVGSALSPLMAWASAKAGKFVLSMCITVMGKLLYGAMSTGINTAAVGIVLGGLLLTFSTVSEAGNGLTRVHQWMTWKSRVDEPLIAASKTSNPEKAKKYIGGVLDYLKSRNAHTASTAIVYDSPEDDMGEFVSHIESAEKGVDGNVHSVRLGPIVDVKSNSVTSPWGSSLAPYNTEFFVAALLGLIGMMVGGSTLMISLRVQKKKTKAEKEEQESRQNLRNTMKAAPQEQAKAPQCVCPGGPTCGYGATFGTKS